jgi:carbon-monoxide dehydrogenase small subunit
MTAFGTICARIPLAINDQAAAVARLPQDDGSRSGPDLASFLHWPARIACLDPKRRLQPAFAQIGFVSPDWRGVCRAGRGNMGGFMSEVSLVVNGRKVSGAVEDRTLLVHFLRENLGLTGTHVGCDTSQCGACVVHVDGKAMKSCTMLAVQASGSTITTIEGLANGADLHPVQAAFKEHHGLQCGFCTPGMIMTATDMIRRHPEGLDEPTVRAELEGNICRCTGYHNIVKAILAASKTMSKASKSKAKKAA